MHARLVALIPPLLMMAACSPSTSDTEEPGSGDASHVASADASRPAVEQADARTLKIVGAADAFLDSLNAEQRQQVIYGWNDADQRGRWSNFPGGIVDRRGLEWGELNESQRSKLNALLEATLGAKGLANVRQQMAADDELAHTDAGPPGAVAPAGADKDARIRPPANFGSAYYAVAFLGTPAADAPWMLQFGGHHLAINATVAGPHVSFSPMLTGGQPLRFDNVNLAADERAAQRSLFDSLSVEQKAKAVVSTERPMVQLGPGRDDTILAPEGIPGSAMDAGQKAKLLALIHTRLDLINTDDAKPLFARIEKELDQTYFGWWAPTAENSLAYVRVTGPSLVLEYSPEQLGRDDPTQHAHNIYRNRTNDYGKGWVKGVTVKAQAGPGGPR